MLYKRIVSERLCSRQSHDPCSSPSVTLGLSHIISITMYGILIFLRGLLKIDMFVSNELSNPWHFLKQQFKVYQSTLMSVSKRHFYTSRTFEFCFEAIKSVLVPISQVLSWGGRRDMAGVVSVYSQHSMAISIQPKHHCLWTDVSCEDSFLEKRDSGTKCQEDTALLFTPWAMVALSTFLTKISLCPCTLPITLSHLIHLISGGSNPSQGLLIPNGWVDIKAPYIKYYRRTVPWGSWSHVLWKTSLATQHSSTLGA